MFRLPTAFCLAVLSLIFLGGCLPNGNVQVDEQGDSHYQRGRSLVNSMDFNGAMDEFEKALENNPRSASAHFELGWLCEQKTKDYAAAIYHYRKYLELQPKSSYSDKARDHIKVCRDELARDVYSQPNTQNLQHEIDRLTTENAQLKSKIQEMTAQTTASTADLAKAQRAAQTAETQRLAALQALESYKTYYATARPAPAPAPTVTPTPSSRPPVVTPPPVNTRVHVVKAGETIAAIARIRSVKENALLAANPGVDPRKLKVGQKLNLP